MSKMNVDEYLVHSEYHFGDTDIVIELSTVASQENHDGHEHNLMQQSSEYIEFLRAEIEKLESEVKND